MLRNSNISVCSLQVTVLNIDPLNNDGGIIYAKDGRAEVRWRMNGDQQLTFQNRLKNPSQPKENLNSCIRHYKTEQDAVFLMKLPHKGTHITCIELGNR